MRTTRRWSVMAFLAVAALLATMFGAGAASATPARPGYTTPVITVNPNSGPVGTAATVHGNLFTPGATGTLTFHSAGVTVGSFTVAADGTFDAPITVPAGEEAAVHTIDADDNKGEHAETKFKVTAGSVGVIVISNPNPKAGESITVSGTSCDPGSTVTVTLDGTTVLGTTTAAADGSYSLVVKIPAGTSAGDHTINVSGSGGTGCSGVEPISVAAGGNNGGGGGLANTGVAVIGIGALGVVLLIGGGLMLMAGRRRRTTLV